jgi:hypothetical protein
MPQFKVGVFPRNGKRTRRYTAYTVWYNPQWNGCCEHLVIAANGSEAKAAAILEHKDKCERVQATSAANHD